MRASRVLSSTLIETPLGLALVVADDGGVHTATFTQLDEVEATREVIGARLEAVVVQDEHPLLNQARRQLNAYFAKKRRAFTLPLELHGTPFQCRVWDALRHIPYGQSVSYAEVARRIGRPKASRAVAQACGANPLVIFVPCHRVIASDGGLGGFSAGLPKKRRLLSLEGHSAVGLPLFSVARHREATVDRESQHQAVTEALPDALLDILQGVRPPSEGDEERLLIELMSHLEPHQLPILASVLAQLSLDSSSPLALTLCEELLTLLCARLLERVPSVEELKCMLHAALITASPSYALIGRRLAYNESLPLDQRNELKQLYRRVMAGEIQVPQKLKEVTVDLWLDLKQLDGVDPWVAHRSDNAHEIFADAGLLWEAVLSAEGALDAGKGERLELLGRLADMYERLGEFTTARDRLLSLVAEHPQSERLAQLRRLEERIEESG